MDMMKEIIALRGGIPPMCDFCGKEFTDERKPVPDEAGEWSCTECWDRWAKEDADGTAADVVHVRDVNAGLVQRKPRECWAIFAEGKQEYLRMWGGKTEAEARSNRVQETDEVVHMIENMK